MSRKENALGSIPNFESVATTTQEFDLFIDEPKEPKKETENKVKEDLKKQLLADAKKQREEQKKNEIKVNTTEGKEIIKQLETTEETTPRTPNNAHIKKPSTKEGIRNGYKRQTFVIREDLLEMIQALCSVNDIMQVDLLEAFIVKGLAGIDEDKKEKALASYRSSKKNKEEVAKRNVEKLFN